MSLSTLYQSAQPEVRTTYEPGSLCPTSTIRHGDDIVCVSGDMRGHGLDITHRKAYERRGVLVTDMVTGVHGTDHDAIVREVREGMVTRAVQLGMVA